MKRARDRWNLLLIVGVAAISLMPLTEAVKATSLFRTTTTTTSTEAAPAEEGAEGIEVETTPASNLTGIPQIDYIHDPNLPRELNGFNLSSYPFFETVPPPEEMDFKCDGLHDGFYAAVAQKCQVYHQCLHGTRYDFLCANYTAFDQKTFICHFVSEVDCINSPKYYSRNDDLYWENKTEVVNPETKIKYSLYSKKDSTYTSPKPRTSNSSTVVQTNTRNEALYKATTSSTLDTTTTTTTSTSAPPPRNRPVRPRRPTRRRRPQYDYYEDDYYPNAPEDDDYYEEDRRPYEGRSGGRRRKRPRPSQRRPAYDDYEDDRYERRPDRTRYDDEDYKERRTPERPRKPQGRRPAEERDQPDEKKYYDDDERPSSRNRKNKPEDKRTGSNDRRPDDKRAESDYDRRPYDSDERRTYERPRRPLRDEDRPLKDDDRPSREEPEKSNPKENRNFRDERPPRDRSNRDDRRDSTRNERRPLKDYHYSDDDDDSYSNENVKTPEPSASAAEGLVKPAGGSLFSKPRIPPRIARPVPNNEKEKYKYITAPSTKVPYVKAAADDEYYDDYEDEPKEVTSPPKPAFHSRTRSEVVEKEKNKPNSERTKILDPEPPPKRTSNFKPRQASQDSRKPQYQDESSYEDFDEPRARRPTSSRGNGDRYSSRKQPPKIEDEYYYDEEPKSSNSKEEKQPLVSNKHKEEASSNERLQPKTEKATDTVTQKPFFQRNRYLDSSTTTTTTTAAPINEKPKNNDDKSEQKSPYVRVVKRPFLPSRGGSPYLPRGLQPLGGKNFNKTTTAAPTTTTTPTTITTTTTTTTTTENIIQQDYSYEADYDVKEEKPTQYKEITSQENYDQKTPINYKDENKDERKQLFLNAQKYIKDIREFPSTSIESNKYNSGSYSSQEKYKNPYDRLQTFKPSPQISEPYKPTNRPFSQKIPENISIKQNLADSIENDYDVTLNDALNPTISNLPQIRNYPSPFIMPADRDYTFSRFRNNYQSDSNAAGSNSYVNYQPRPPTNKIENSQRYQNQGYKQQVADSASSPSELIHYRRTPQSFSIYSADETNSGLRPSHVTYRQVYLGDYSQ